VDIWKFYAITHRDHVICNPTSEEKLDRLVELLRLPRSARVVDIASGKGEFLIRLAQSYGVRGTGVDLSPPYVREARERLRARAPGATIEFLEMNGAEFRPDEPHSCTLASCLGASWIFHGHAGTLDALIGMAAPGGWVLAGEPYWRQEPSDAYLDALGGTKDAFGTHWSNIEAGEERGLELVHTFVSSPDDWDRYEGLQWHAAAQYARDYPHDPDLEEVRVRVARSKEAYARWGRETLGWAIYVFRRRDSADAGRRQGTSDPPQPRG